MSAILMSIHSMVAAMAKNPVWELDAKEAKMLANATAHVAKHYNVAIADKWLAWSHLAQAAAAVYGPRLMASARAPAPQPAPARSTGQPSAFDQLMAIGRAA